MFVVHSKAFISPTITTESVADALIGAAAASVDAAGANGGAGPGGGHDGDHGCGARSFFKKTCCIVLKNRAARLPRAA
jgi:hypothetical protein